MVNAGKKEVRSHSRFIFYLPRGYPQGTVARFFITVLSCLFWDLSVTNYSGFLPIRNYGIEDRYVSMRIVYTLPSYIWEGEGSNVLVVLSTSVPSVQ